MLKEGIDIFVSSKTKKAEELTKQTQVIESNMNKVQDNTNTTTNTNNDTTNNEQQKYDDFAKLQKEHPEWFVGDTYVGNDADAKKKAEEALKQNQDTKNKTNNIIKDVLNTVTSKNNDSIVNYFIESIKLKNNTEDKGGN